ncbi:MAG: hypothetical protein Fur006_20270 [Coleofasciculaceae cyanobacterium]
MLAYVLALVISLGSLAIFLAAFFFPEVHRKEDFIWSGVGLFYALVLWVCAGRITGGVLLGQVASVALLGWFGWQTLSLRRALALPEQRTPISPELQAKLKGASIGGLGQKLQQPISNLLKKKKPKAQTAQSPSETVKPGQQKKTVPSESTTTVEAVTSGATDTSSPTSAPEVTADTTDSSNVVTIIDSRTTATETAPTQAATTEEISSATQVDEPVAERGELSESPELVRPNPPNPELVEAAQKSAPSETSNSSAQAAIPVEEIAPDAELAPPAEPPGDGDPTMRQNPPDADTTP